MNEIKFRIYDTLNDGMIYYTMAELMDAVMTIKERYYHIGDNIHDLIDLIYNDNLNIAQMQYVRQSDMNGIDIYEDDIVRKELCAPDDPVYGYYGGLGIVKKDPHNMGWYIETLDDGDHSFYDCMGVNFGFDEIEVMGNMHENPELLD